MSFSNTGPGANSNDPATTIVVGAGPAGALLAFLLARSGVPVTLIERHQEFAREFRGEGLSPGGQAMFREAGLWQQFAALPHVTFKRMQLYFKSRKIIDTPLATHSDTPAARFVSQPAMLEMIVSEAEKFSSFQFVRGGKTIGLLKDDDRVRGVRIRTNKAEIDLPGRYVFAADGRYSLVRRQAGLDQPKSPQSFDVFWCHLPFPPFYDTSEPCMRGYFGNGRVAVFIPSHNHKLQVGWIIEKGSFRNFRRTGMAEWIERIADFVDDEMAAFLRDNKENAGQPFLLDVVSDIYETWSVPGLTLLGDAAHPMSPFGAQGINLALRDAVVMANHFVPALRGGSSVQALDAAALAFDHERRPEIQQIARYQAMAPKFQLSTSRWVDVAAIGMRLANASGLAFLASKLGSKFRHPMVHGVSDIRLKVSGEKPVQL